jgi:general secretion pathway protein K
MRGSRQRGVAVVTAILVVAVAASAATYMLSQQSATLNQAALVTARAQADAYAHAGLDWARGILAEDGRRTSIDSLAEGWA